MPDAFLSVRKGAKVGVEAVLRVSDGTLAILTTPSTPKVTIYDAAKTPLGSYNNVTCSYYTTAPSSQVRAQLIVDLADAGFVENATYYADFVIYVQASLDGKTRRELINLALQVESQIT